MSKVLKVTVPKENIFFRKFFIEKNSQKHRPHSLMNGEIRQVHNVENCSIVIDYSPGEDSVRITIIQKANDAIYPSAVEMKTDIALVLVNALIETLKIEVAENG